jgi:hypothetical protein
LIPSKLREVGVYRRVIPVDRRGRGGWKDGERLLDRVWAGGADVVQNSHNKLA